MKTQVLDLRLCWVLTTLGIVSSLPLSLTSTTLQAWYTDAGISTLTIGFLSLVGQPYLYKFLWAPLLDRYQIPRLTGRRRGWMLVLQIALVFAIFAMAVCNPKQQTGLLAGLALLTAFLSASLDIVLDAYRTDILEPLQRGVGASLYVAGARMGMLLSGGIALIIAGYLGWHVTYALMAGLMGIGCFSACIAKEPASTVQTPSLHWWDTLVKPLLEMRQRPHLLTIMVFIVLYKLGDALVSALSMTFFLRQLHFSLTEVGLIYKGIGFVAILIGTLSAGLLLRYVSLYRSLWFFGVLQAATVLIFMLLSMLGKRYDIFVITIAAEQFAVGGATTVLVAFLMSLCDHRYTATQYALLSAVSAIARIMAGPLAGVLLLYVNWTQFYLGAAILCIPGLVLLFRLRHTIAYH